MLSQFLEEMLESFSRRDRELLGQFAVHRLDSLERGGMPSAGRPASSDSSWSVIPESAECTTAGRRPSAISVPQHVPLCCAN